MRTETPRVAYVVKRFPRYSETFIVTELLAHEEAGLEVEIFSLRPPNDTHFQDQLGRLRAPVRYLPFEGLRAADLWTAAREAASRRPEVWTVLAAASDADARDVHQALLLARALHEGGFTHVHAHFASLPTTVGRLAARMAGLPYTFTAHAKDIFHESVDPVDLGRKLADATAVVTVSEFNLAHLQATYGRRARHVRRIYNGLDLGQFPCARGDRAANTIVAVGRLVAKKGFEDLIDACALLAARGVDCACDIVGGGELEGALRERIERHRLGGRVALLGPRPQSEVARSIRRAAVFAAPCVVGDDGNRDGLPTTILEAMASGTPAVSTPVTGIPEVIRDGETGLLVPERTPSVLADGLQRVLQDADLGRALAARARRLIEAEFDARTNAAAVRQLFAQRQPTEGRAEALPHISGRRAAMQGARA